MSGSRIDRADRRARDLLRRIGDELRAARRAAGLSLTTAADVARTSRSELSRIERGEAEWVSVSTLSRVASVVGLDLWARLYPGGDAVRDVGHLRLQQAFLALVGRRLSAMAEVPIGEARDLRAWDLCLVDPARQRAGVEFDTRLDDIQAYLRRLARKRQDGAVDRLIAVVADTRSNRAAVAAGAVAIHTLFEVDPPDAWLALAEGRLPAGDSLLFVRMHPTRREQATRNDARVSGSLAPRDEGSDRAIKRERGASRGRLPSPAPTGRDVPRTREDRRADH